MIYKTDNQDRVVNKKNKESWDIYDLFIEKTESNKTFSVRKKT